MDKNQWAKTPPMGWNSWDCYGAAVSEKEIRGNADYMAQNLKEYGWEYIVCDIQWYEPAARSSRYNNFFPLEMDEYSRLIPAVNRFPSSAGGKGFRPLADYIHSLGLKFGIHIMRGIPRQAVHAASKIKGTKATARDIAHGFSVCAWNTDMYGVNPRAEGAQEYYDSLFELYAGWGVDFVKVDDICVTYFAPNDLYSAKEEIELIRRAVDRCGRKMVLSLSPGPAPLEEKEHLALNANMWRITNDFWDRWDLLLDMFLRCEGWAPYVKEGCWPDCDMLPLGHIGIRSEEYGRGDRMTDFTPDEQVTMMTLWCVFRSPLMMGGEMQDNDPWTLSLLTNREVLRLLSHSEGARQILRTEEEIVWSSRDEDGSFYVALFNIGPALKTIDVSLSDAGLGEGEYLLRDLWAGKDGGLIHEKVSAQVSSHGAVLYKLIQK